MLSLKLLEVCETQDDRLEPIMSHLDDMGDLQEKLAPSTMELHPHLAQDSETLKEDTR